MPLGDEDPKSIPVQELRKGNYYALNQPFEPLCEWFGDEEDLSSLTREKLKNLPLDIIEKEDEEEPPKEEEVIEPPTTVRGDRKIWK